MGLFGRGKGKNKAYYSTMAVNAFNEGDDQKALMYASLGYDGSVQNIQYAIQDRNMKRQMKQQQEEFNRQSEETTAATEQASNQAQKSQVIGTRRNAKENSSQSQQNLTQGSSSSGTWLKRALGGEETNNSDEWY